MVSLLVAAKVTASGVASWVSLWALPTQAMWVTLSLSGAASVLLHLAPLDC